jgi:ABC transporter substrate binding protein
MIVIRAAVIAALALLVAPLAVEAQQTRKVPRIGVLGGQTPESSSPIFALRDGLRELGYVEGQNIAIEWRSTTLYANRAHIAQLAVKHRLPTSAWERELPEAGCLMSYGASTPDMARRAAYFVDKILKGAKPADLPVEQPTKFELVINMKTAKALGLTIPPSLLGRADQIIQ